MTQAKLTSYDDRQLSESLYHYPLNQRSLGKACKMTDIDALMYRLIDPAGRWHEDNMEAVAIIDFKHGNTDWIARNPALHMAARVMKIPYYVCIYYLQPQLFPVSMYYLMSANRPEKPQWLSPKRFSQWQHQIRQEEWNANEPLTDRDGMLLKNMWSAKTLGDLPSEETIYDLPERITI